MNILIYTNKNNISEIIEKIQSLAQLFTIEKSNDCAKLESRYDTFKIRKYNESQRGNRSKIILYDGDFTSEELLNMSCQLCDKSWLVHAGKKESETLIAPFGIIKQLLRDDVTYINTIGAFEDEEIRLVTKDLVKAICFFERNNGKLYCHEDDEEDSELWSKECYEHVEPKDEYNDYLSLIDFISRQ